MELSEHGWRAWLRIDCPDRIIYRGVEPGRRWTERGATTVFAGGPMAAALVTAMVLNVLGIPALIPVLMLLSLGVLGWLLVVQIRRRGPGTLDRAVDYAWTLLAGRLVEQELAGDALGFLAGLARFSMNHGQAALRESILHRLMPSMTPDLPIPWQAAFWQLLIHDQFSLDRDAVASMADVYCRSLSGQTPMSLPYLEAADCPAWLWQDQHRTRLQLLVCREMFAAGFGLQDLIGAARSWPALAEIVEVNNQARLAQLRLLWNLRSSRPWAGCGQAYTALELAQQNSRPIAAYPGLLLWQPGESHMELAVCDREISFQGTVIPERPESIEVKQHASGYEIVAGSSRIQLADDPDETVRRLERWCQYYFLAFRPQAAAILTDLQISLQRNEKPCSACGLTK